MPPKGVSKSSAESYIAVMSRAGVGVWVAVAAVLGWVVGVALLDSRRELGPAPALWTLVLASALGLVLISHHARRGWPSPALAILLSFLSAGLMAHGSSGLRTAWRLQDRLPHVLEGVPLVVVGRVADLPRRSARGVQFILRIEGARTLQGQPVEGLPRLAWIGWWADGPAQEWLSAPVVEPQPGERWALPVHLKRPHGTLNPWGFDAERWFLEQDLGASGAVASAHRGQALRLQAAPPHWRSPATWRATLRERIDAHVPDPALAGLVAGLTIGDQSSVDAQDWQRFRDAGVAHLLSISGLHITAFASLMLPVVAWVWRRSPTACLWLPAPQAGAWLGGVCALAYALLAGWGLPAQRTIAMLAVATALGATGLRWPSGLVWVLAAAPVVVLDPWAVGQASFWLSFAAVGLLLLSGHGHSPPGPAPAEPAGFSGSALAQRAKALAWAAGGAIRTQTVTALGLAPLAAVCFQQISVVGVAANLLAVPWVTFVLTPICLLGLVWPDLWGVLPRLIQPLRESMDLLLSLPVAVVSVAATGSGELLLALAGAALALAALPMPVRLAGVLLMLPLLLPAPTAPEPGRFEAWALDVGQGSAVLVRTHAHALLIDAGPGWGQGQDSGQRVVLPVLRGLGVRRLDLLVVTHRDIDHVGGAASVLRAVPVDALSSSLEPDHPLLRRGPTHRPCLQGQAWQWDGVRMEVLHPDATPRPRAKPNAQSCVIRIEDSQGRALLVTGDIEREQELALVRRPGAAGLRSDALVVPHHGSKTSSTPEFLRAVDPRWAIAQTGYRNRHGHPAPAVVERLRQQAIDLRSSPQCGAWIWPSEKSPKCWRHEALRHWHDSPQPIPPDSGD